jgi:hypothetical protein
MPSWDTAGPLTNPVVNAILADTGPLGPGGKSWSVWVSSSVAAVVVVEYRDAANAANVKAHTIPMAAMSTILITLPNLDTADQERLRLRLNAAITGVMQGSIFG